MEPLAMPENLHKTKNMKINVFLINQGNKVQQILPFPHLQLKNRSF
jgi:hypothetical protein